MLRTALLQTLVLTVLYSDPSLWLRGTMLRPSWLPYCNYQCFIVTSSSAAALEEAWASSSLQEPALTHIQSSPPSEKGWKWSHFHWLASIPISMGSVWEHPEQKELGMPAGEPSPWLHLLAKTKKCINPRLLCSPCCWDFSFRSTTTSYWWKPTAFLVGVRKHHP